MLSTQTREAQARMNEMRQLIGKRLEGEYTPRSRAGTLPSTPPAQTTDTFSADGIVQTLQGVVSEADQHLSRAASKHETMHDDLKLLTSDLKEVSQSTYGLEIHSILIRCCLEIIRSGEDET
jgi:hypothetical protein